MKFKTDDQSFSSTLKKRIEEYFKTTGKSKYGGKSILIKTIVLFSIYLAPLVLMLTLDFAWWWLLVFAITMGIAKAGIGFCVMHDAIHGTFSANKNMNKVMSFSSYLIGAAVTPWKIKHNVLHHTYTNIHGMDTDIESKALLRLSFNAPLWKVHKLQYIYAFFFYMFTSLAFLIGDFVDLVRYQKDGILKKQGGTFGNELFKLILFRVLYLGVFISLPVIFTDIPWWGTIIGFFTIHFVTGLILSSVFQIAHLIEETSQHDIHDGEELEHSWAQHQLETTANFAAGNRFLTWYTGGLNHQVEHHLFPNISHVHYHKLYDIVKRTAREFNLPYYEKKTFWSALKSHIITLKSLGRLKVA